MNNEEKRLVGDLLDRAAAVLGVSRKQTLAALVTIVSVVGLSFYLAVTSGLTLFRQYESGGDPSMPEAAEGRLLLERLELPTLLEEGELVPEAPIAGDGKLLRCGPVLEGQAGLDIGWVWDDRESGCRRVRLRH